MLRSSDHYSSPSEAKSASLSRLLSSFDLIREKDLGLDSFSCSMSLGAANTLNICGYSLNFEIICPKSMTRRKTLQLKEMYVYNHIEYRAHHLLFFDQGNIALYKTDAVQGETVAVPLGSLAFRWRSIRSFHYTCQSVRALDNWVYILDDQYTLLRVDFELLISSASPNSVVPEELAKDVLAFDARKVGRRRGGEIRVAVAFQDGRVAYLSSVLRPRTIGNRQFTVSEKPNQLGFRIALLDHGILIAEYKSKTATLSHLSKDLRLQSTYTPTGCFDHKASLGFHQLAVLECTKRGRFNLIFCAAFQSYLVVMAATASKLVHVQTLSCFGRWCFQLLLIKEEKRDCLMALEYPQTLIKFYMKF